MIEYIFLYIVEHNWCSKGIRKSKKNKSTSSWYPTPQELSGICKLSMTAKYEFIILGTGINLRFAGCCNYHAGRIQDNLKAPKDRRAKISIKTMRRPSSVQTKRRKLNLRFHTELKEGKPSQKEDK